MVIVTTDITHVLCWLTRPKWHTNHLIVRDSSSDAKLYALLMAGNTRQESTLVMIRERAAQGIAHIVAKSGNARHTIRMFLISQLILIITQRADGPALSISDDAWINLVQRLTQLVHRLDIMDRHQIKPETIQMIFLGPITHRLDDVFPHHRMIAGGLISASRAVAKASIGPHPVKIARNGPLESALLGREGMIVNHVKDHPDARLMQGLYHLLKLLDPYFWIVRISGIRTLRHIIVFGIISPVILVLVERCLVNGREVERGQDMHMRDAQFLKMINTGLLTTGGHRAPFGQGQEFPLMLNTGCWMYREVTVMHLIDDNIRRIGH